MSASHFIRIVIIALISMSGFTYGQEGASRSSGKIVGNAPAIRFPEGRVHDFGEILVNKAVTYEFEFINEGPGDLRILKVETSCGCAAAVPSKGPIAPGKKGIIRVTMIPPVANPITKHIIDIQTNDPKAKHIRLAIKADVWAPMTFSPKRVILTGPRGQEISRVARVDFDRRIKLEGIEVDYDKKVLNVDFKRVAERRFRINISVADTKVPKRFHTEVTIKPRAEGIESVKIPVSIEVMEDLRARPGAVFFGPIAHLEERTVTISVTWKGVSNFHLSCFQLSPEWVNVEIERMQGSSGYYVRFLARPPENLTQGLHHGNALLRAESKKESRELRIPIFLIIRKRTAH